MTMIYSIVLLCVFVAVMANTENALQDVTMGRADINIASNMASTSNTSTLVTIAGTVATPGSSGDGSLAIDATLDYPTSAVADKAGNVYLTDISNNRVRFVAESTGIISTYAGCGGLGSEGDGGLATAANLVNPSYLALNSMGDLYIASYPGAIRIVTKATGIISTAKSSSCPTGLAFDRNDNLFYTDKCSNQIMKIATNGESAIIGGVGGPGAFGGDGASATSAAFNFPNGISVDAWNNIYVADMMNYSIRKIDSITGVVSTIAGTGVPGHSGDGAQGTVARIGYVYGMSVAGNILYMADSTQHVIRMVDLASGIINTFLGTGTPGYDATTSQLNNPFDVNAVNGVVYIADTGNYIVRKVAAL